MEVEANTLKILGFICVLIFSFSITSATEVDVGLNVTIGLNVTLPPLPTSPPGQVAWVGPLRICDLNVSDTRISGCFQNIVGDITRSWGGGIHSLGIPPMDPFLLGNLSVAGNSPSVTFAGNFTNISVTGFNDLSGVKISLNTAGNNISFEGYNPKIRMSGFYDASGTARLSFIAIPIHGEGPFWMEFYNLTFLGTAQLKNETVGNDTILVSYNLVTDFTVLDFDFIVQNFGGPALGPLVNGVALLTRWKILESIKEELNLKIADIFSSVLKTFLPTQPYLSGMVN